MFDCANVEMRELLPDYVAGTVDAATRARVEAHLATCAECASELETLRLVRSSFAAAPAIDVQRIVAALPKAAPVRPRIGRDRAPVKRWMDWRVAAAVTVISVGGLSLAIANRQRPSDGLANDSSLAKVITDSHVVLPSQKPPTPEPRVIAKGPDTTRPSRPSVSSRGELSFGGGVDDLDDASLRALLGALDELDRAPVAPSAEPDPTPVLPVIRDTKQGDR